MSSVEFHELQVSDIEELTEDSVSITLAVPRELHEKFSFTPGQHVTVRATVDGQDVRRSYSICTKPEEGRLRIGVKRLEGGAFSTYATRRLRPGDTLGVTPPVGEFTLVPDLGADRHLCAIAAGSGITPVLSMATSVLESEPLSRFTLVFGNRAARTVMFLEALEALKDRFPDRFHLIHLFSREAPDLPLFHGRIDGPKLEALFGTLIDPSSVDRWLLCGPVAMVEAARMTLTGRGRTGGSDRRRIVLRRSARSHAAGAAPCRRTGLGDAEDHPRWPLDDHHDAPRHLDSRRGTRRAP